MYQDWKTLYDFQTLETRLLSFVIECFFTWLRFFTEAVARSCLHTVEFYVGHAMFVCILFQAKFCKLSYIFLAIFHLRLIAATAGQMNNILQHWTIDIQRKNSGKTFGIPLCCSEPSHHACYVVFFHEKLGENCLFACLCCNIKKI